MADKSKWRKQMAQSILDDAPFFSTTNDHIARALAAKQAPFQSSGEVRSTPGILGVDRTEYGLPTREFFTSRMRDFAGQAAYEMPGLGEALSARDAATAATRGDYIAAGASALAANPFWPVPKLGRSYGKAKNDKPYELADEIYNALRAEYPDHVPETSNTGGRNPTRSGSSWGDSAYIYTRLGDIRVSDHPANLRPGELTHIYGNKQTLDDHVAWFGQRLKASALRRERDRLEAEHIAPVQRAIGRAVENAKKSTTQAINDELRKRGLLHLKNEERKAARSKIRLEMREAGLPTQQQAEQAARDQFKVRLAKAQRIVVDEMRKLEK